MNRQSSIQYTTLNQLNITKQIFLNIYVSFSIATYISIYIITANKSQHQNSLIQMYMDATWNWPNGISKSLIIVNAAFGNQTGHVNNCQLLHSTSDNLLNILTTVQSIECRRSSYTFRILFEYLLFRKNKSFLEDSSSSLPSFLPKHLHDYLKKLPIHVTPEVQAQQHFY